jgi:hypothetical protein
VRREVKAESERVESKEEEQDIINPRCSSIFGKIIVLM